METALIFEPNHRGHRFYYVKLILDALIAKCIKPVIATTQDAPRSAEYAVHLKNLEGKFTLDNSITPRSSSLLLSAAQNTFALRRVVRAHSPRRVFIPYGDGGFSHVAATANLLGIEIIPSDVTSDTILMRGTFAYPAVNAVQRLKYALSRSLITRVPWTRVHFIDEIPYNHVMDRGGPLAGRAVLLPDPVEAALVVSRETARQRLGVPVDGRYIGCVGSLDERKGIDLLVRAFVAAKLRPSDRLLLVGEPSPAVASILRDARNKTSSDRILLIEGYVSDEVLNLALSAMDVVCTPYPRHIGSASIVIRAAAADRLVLGNNFGWMGAVIEQNGLGSTCNVKDPREFQAAVVASLRCAESWAPGTGARRFVQANSPSRFLRQLVDCQSECPSREGSSPPSVSEGA